MIYNYYNYKLSGSPHLDDATGALCPVRSSASSLVPHMRPLELGFTRRSPQRLPWLVFL